jgi:hypothetical protein
MSSNHLGHEHTLHLRKATAMRRRDILAGAGSLATGATVGFPAPAIAQGIRQLKLVTDWPEATPGLHSSAIRFAQTIGAATGGRIKIEVFPAGALVRPFETFDAVSAGVADMYHTTRQGRLAARCRRTTEKRDEIRDASWSAQQNLAFFAPRSLSARAAWLARPLLRIRRSGSPRQ